jgi:hypothetical protein
MEDFQQFTEFKDRYLTVKLYSLSGLFGEIVDNTILRNARFGYRFSITID